MKKHTFLKFIALLLVVLLVVPTITACGVFNEEFSDGSNESSETSINVSNNNSDSKVDSSKPDISEAEQDNVITFLACPDNIIHPSVFYDAINRAAAKNGTTPSYTDLHNAEYDFSQIYEHVADKISNADIAYINQETLVGGTSGAIHGYSCFNSPQAIADTVVDLGFDVANVAHNHMLDSGDTRYLENCNNVFENNGVEVIGYYPDEESTNNITVIEREGIKVAFLAYTYSTNGIPLPKNSTFVIPTFNRPLVEKQVKLAKEAADIVIASCHWGWEDSYSPNSEQLEYAELFCELGVDVVLGMHPHVIQPMEWMTSSNGTKTLVVYSLGNFVSGMYNAKNMLAGMLELNIRKDAKTGDVSIEAPMFIPTVTHYTEESKVASNDTGYRNFKIYYLKDYTSELAAEHGVSNYEKSHASTLVGGKFSLDTLRMTLNKYIPDEFLPDRFKSEEE